MIQKKLFVLLFFGCFFISCNNEIKIEGKWYVDKFEDSKGSFKKSSNKWIEFHGNGSLTGGKIGEAELKNGFWKYDTLNKLLTIQSESKYGDEGTYIIEKLSQKQMILVQDTIKVYFKK